MTEAPPTKIQKLDRLDAKKEKRYLFLKRFLGKYTPNPRYLWNGGWLHD